MCDDSHRQTEAVRTCLTLLIGMSYADPKLCELIRTAIPYRDQLPRDLIMLLEAIEKRDGSAVDTWFADVKHIDLASAEGVKLPVRLAGFLLRHHWRIVTQQSIGRMSKVVETPVGELLAGMKRLVAELEAAGIQPAEQTRKDG